MKRNRRAKLALKSRSFAKLARAPWDLRRRGVYVGRDIQTGQECYLPLARFATGFHVLGAPGLGKTSLLTWLVRMFARAGLAVVVLACKGSFGSDLLRCLVADGQADRVVYLPGGDGKLCGLDPLRPNGGPAMLQSLLVREAVLAGHGNDDTDIVAQLARSLLYVLASCREAGWTLTEATELLRPRSPLRAVILGQLKDDHLARAFEYLDELPRGRQDDVVDSAIARLEALTLSPTVRGLLTQQTRSLDVPEAIENARIVIADLQLYRWFARSEVRTVARMLTNLVVSTVFSRSPERRRPVVFVADEVQEFWSPHLARAVELGRELKFFTILSHQFLHQVTAEDASERALHALLGCARSRAVFGGMPIDELELLVRQMFLQALTPWAVKDELVISEFHPKEVVRRSVTNSWSANWSFSPSVTRSWSVQRARRRGTSVTEGESEMTAETESRAVGRHRGRGVGHVTGVTAAETVLPSGDVVHSGSDLDSMTVMDTEGASELEGHASTRARSRHRTQSVHKDESEGETCGFARGVTQVFGGTVSESVSHNPFITHEKHDRVANRCFLTIEEQVLEYAKRVERLPVGHYVLKVPGHGPLFLESPWVERPRLSDEFLTAGLEQIFGQSYYASPQEIEAEEQARSAQLLGAYEFDEDDEDA